MSNFKWLLFGLCLLLLVADSAASAESGSKNDKPIVAVANYPLKYFTERIVGNHVEVIFPIPSDIDPAFWIPEPNGVLAFQSADVILLNGATYSKWLDKVTLLRRKMVNTSEGFKEQYIQKQEFTTHRHGPQGKHAHAGLAFTTWLDFQQAIQQAEAVRHAVTKLLPEQEKHFGTNFLALKTDLLNLDRRIEEILNRKRARPLLASHPVYNYFARRYGSNIRSVLWEPEIVPNARQWAELENIIKEHPAKWMIWEGDPHPDSIARLESLGIGSVVFDPAGNVPDNGDFLSVMHQNVQNLKSAYR